MAYNLAAIFIMFLLIIFPEVTSLTLWEIFCKTGKVDDYLNYRREFSIAADENTERSACYAAFDERPGSTGNPGR